MKKIKLILGILIGSLYLSSCSNDDEFDIVIGEWQAIQQFESDVAVDLSPNLECIYIEFTPDNRFLSDFISSDNLPDNCNTLNFIFGSTWTNIGNNNYRIKIGGGGEGEIYTYYKDNSNLVEERPNGITKIIYKPYEQ